MLESHERLTIESLRQKVTAGEVDNVIVAFTDMQGRLEGKGCSARYFLDEVLSHGAEACNYLLAVDVEQSTVSGYEISSWERGYGDFVLFPTSRRSGCCRGRTGPRWFSAISPWADGSPVRVPPREVLKEQVRRLAEHGLVAFVGTELEFIAFNTSFEDAWACAYRNLVPVNQYDVDYSILGVDRAEPLLGAIRRGMEGLACMPSPWRANATLVSTEIAFRYADALTTCDNHVVYKNGAKEIAASLGKSLTFMPKFNGREGNSCHIHISLRGANGEAVLAGDKVGGVDLPVAGPLGAVLAVVAGAGEHPARAAWRRRPGTCARCGSRIRQRAAGRGRVALHRDVPDEACRAALGDRVQRAEPLRSVGPATGA